eukprot:5819854-Prymnesium_polylepis.1
MPPAIVPPAAAHVHVPSLFGPPVPIAEVHATLCVEAKPCEAEGNCFPLSAMCGYELNTSEVETPAAATTEAVRLARKGA